jgi:carbon storage regulator
MLVLTRRVGEAILIAGNVRVTVAAVKGNQFCLGITAPSSVPGARRKLLGERPEGAGAATTGCPAPGPSVGL